MKEKKICAQCKDPRLKGLHTCEKRRRPEDGGPEFSFEEYAKVLRTAWLNPSDKDAQMAVHSFEYDHNEELFPHLRRWNGRE